MSEDQEQKEQKPKENEENQTTEPEATETETTASKPAEVKAEVKPEQPVHDLAEVKAEVKPEQPVHDLAEVKPEVKPEQPVHDLAEVKPEVKPEQPVHDPYADDGPVKVISLADLKEESEYDPEEVAFMSKLYEDTMQQIKSGEIITGRVISVNDRDVAVDIGFKSEGTVSIDEFEDPDSLKIGDEIEVFLEDIEGQDGQLVLSKRKADFVRVWGEIIQIYERGETIKGRCIRRIKGGIVVDVRGIDAFLPGSQIDVHPVRDFDAWISQICEFRIVKVNEQRKNIVLSRKVLIEETLREVREQILREIQIGQTIEGVVKNITDFGAFVDLGGVDGLLHITDISWGRINHPSEIVTYDEKLDVRVLDFDPVRKRISVGLKQLHPHPWDGVEDRFPVHDKVQGKVVSITKYGAFIELEEGIEGLIHISEMSWTQHIKHPSQILNIGQEIECVVLTIDAENRKISLGLKQTEEDPWEKLEQKYSANTLHKGVVRDLVPFGAFVELEEGVEGLVHISDLSWTRKIRHPGEVVKKGEEIDVMILSFDRNERRIALGHKQTAENPWDLFAGKYPLGTELQGKVVRTVDKGAIIEIEWALESFLPVSHFGKDQETGRGRALKEGDELTVEVIDFDKNNKKIVVSASNIQKRTEEAEYEEYLMQQKDGSEAPAEQVDADAAPAEEAEKTEAAEPAIEASETEDTATEAVEEKAAVDAPADVEEKVEAKEAEPEVVEEKAAVDAPADVEETQKAEPKRGKLAKKSADKKKKAPTSDDKPPEEDNKKKK